MPRASYDDTRVYVHPSGARIVVIAAIEPERAAPLHTYWNGLQYQLDMVATAELRNKLQAESHS